MGIRGITMFIEIMLAIVFARIKGYRLKPLLRCYALYPLMIVELIYIFFQINTFAGDYSYVQYAPLLKTINLYTLAIPIIVYKLYKPGFYGSALILIGTMMNRFVMSQNGGKMPVFATLSKITGYFNEAEVSTIDNIHILGDEATKYKILTDFIDVGYSVLSVGDVLIHSFVAIVIYNVIKEINIGIESKKDIGEGFI